MASGFSAFFLPAAATSVGHRFCIYHPPAGESAPRGMIVYLHPFAEEMNKSRRMAALQSRALSENGYAVLQIDFLGCGDSSGDFGDATWDAWIDDVGLACNWLRQKQIGFADTSPYEAPLWLWGLRAGCLLALAAESRLRLQCNFLFWQPPTSGKLLLQQFLRLKVAADMLSGQSKGVMEGLKQQLQSGHSVEIAGYLVSSPLALGLETATLNPELLGMGQSSGYRLECIEISPREDASVNLQTAKAMETWNAKGWAANAQVVNGPAFWQTTEIEDAPALISATLAALREPAFAPA
jgi:uncharacterized protein